MSSIRSIISRNRKTLIVIVGIILALLITLKSNELFSVPNNTSERQEIVLPEVADNVNLWLNTLKKNSQYIYHTYQNIRIGQN